MQPSLAISFVRPIDRVRKALFFFNGILLT